MAYRPDSWGAVRDKAYPSEIAAQRPMMAPRIHCPTESSLEEPPDHGEYETDDSSSKSLRGDRNDSPCEKFNRELRGGHAGRNDGDE